MRVWIDSDLCSGCGLCSEWAPDIFVTSKDDGLSYVHRDGQNFDDHDEAHPSGSQGAIPLAPEQLRRAVEAAEECPGEIIFIELD